MTNTTDKVAGITLTADNAKKFANRLKSTLKNENIEFKTSKCYDILAKTFGSSNWHELNQHLMSKDTLEIKQPISMSENTLPTLPKNQTLHLTSLFNMNWPEFKHLVGNLCDTLNFDLLHRETVECILEMTHYGLDKSFLDWSKIEQILLPESKFIEWLEPTQLFPDQSLFHFFPDIDIELAKSCLENFKKIIYSKKTFDYDKIFRFIHLLQFLNNNNVILKMDNISFIPNNVLNLTPHKRNDSFFPFINDIIYLADSVNDNTVTFHELIIILFSKTSLLQANHEFNDIRSVYKYRSSIAKELFDNYKFVSYLLNNLNQYVNNHYSTVVTSINDSTHILLEIILNYYPKNNELYQHILKIKNDFMHSQNNFNITFILNINSSAIAYIDSNHTHDLETSFSTYAEALKIKPQYIKASLPVEFINLSKQENLNNLIVPSLLTV